MSVRHGKAARVSKDIHRNVINDMRRLCFGGALLPAFFFEK